MKIPKLYFVTPNMGEDFESWRLLIEKVIAGGVDMVQIRDKETSKQKLFDAVKEIQPLLKKANVPMIINDHVDIALALRADGVHVGQSDLKVSQARAILGNEAIIGLSVETIEQAVDVKYENLTYLAASPVFASNTKKDCGKPWSMLNLRELCATIHYPIFAIGGIDLNNLEQLLPCGIAGIAVISAIANASCPKIATEKFLVKMRKYVDS